VSTRPYKVLIIGGGGREHALAWKCAQSPRVAEVLVAPGNAGTAREPRVRNVPIAADRLEELADLAASEGVQLTIVGPEGPLVAGIVDLFASCSSTAAMVAASFSSRFPRSTLPIVATETR